MNFEKDDELSRGETAEENANGTYSHCYRQVSSQEWRFFRFRTKTFTNTGSSSIQALICKFCLFNILCFPIRKLSIVFPNDRGGKTKFGVNLSFAAKFGRRVKATEVGSSLRMSPD